MAKTAINERYVEKGSAALRRTPRRIFVHPMGILVRGVYQVSQALQLSEGGLLFQSEEPFRAKQQIVVSLVLPGGGVVVARSEIVYEKPAAGKMKHFGVKFAPLPLHLKRMIRNYVTAKTQAEAEKELDELGED